MIFINFKAFLKMQKISLIPNNNNYLISLINFIIYTNNSYIIY